MQLPDGVLLELNLLGEVSLLRNGIPVRLPSQKAFCMLAYTVLSHKNQAGIPDLIDLLWPHSSERNARHSLSQLLYQMNRQCEPARLLTRDGDILIASTLQSRCDVVEFERLLRIKNWRKALSTYGGTFLLGLDVAADMRFEHWRDGIDARLAMGYRYCVDRLIASADHDDPADVEAWTRQAMLILPMYPVLTRLHFRAVAEQGRYEEAEQGLKLYLHSRHDELAGSEREELTKELTLVVSTRDELSSSVLARDLPFVGRTAEVRQLREIWSETLAHSAHAVILTGEPGIGKSRILDQLSRFAAIRGARVLAAPASPATAQIPFGGMRELLSGVIGGPKGVPHEEFPQLRKLVLMKGCESGDELSESMLYAECERVVRRLVAERPLLLTIDDLQWLDKSSLRCIAYITYRCQHEKLLLAMCARPEGEHLQDRFRGIVGMVSLKIGPMPEPMAAALLDTFWANRAVPIDAEVRHTLLTRAAGNPFFLTALAEDSLRSAGKESSNAVPESIASLITSRVRQVSSAAQDALRALAILRTEERIEVIATLMRRSPVRTARAIEELVRLQLVTDGIGGVSVAHDIIADVVYGSIPNAIRKYLHRSAALALKSRGPAVVANHASRARDWVIAFPAALKAATNAASIGAYSDAEFFFRMAQTAAQSEDNTSEVAAAYLTFTCGVDRFSSGLSGVAAARRHFAREHDLMGLLRCDAVELDGAIQDGLRSLDQLTSEALDLVRRAQELGSTRLAAEMLSVFYRAVELGSIESISADWLGGAISIAESADADWKVTLLGKAAVLSYFVKGMDAAKELADRLPLLAGDDVRLRALADVYTGITLMLMGKLREAEQDYEEALNLARDPALADAFHKASMNLAVLETDMGQYDLARTRLCKAMAGGRATAVSLANMGFLCLETGDVDGADNAAVLLQSKAAKLNAPMLLAAAATLSGLSAWERRDYSAAESQAERIAGVIDEIPFSSDDSYARILLARTKGRTNPKVAVDLLSQPVKRAAVPQLRVDLERAYHLARLDPEAGRLALARVNEEAREMGATPIAARAAAFIETPPLH